MPEQTTQSKLYNALVIVTSDSCYNDPGKDESGSFVVEQLKLTGLFERVNRDIVSDDESIIVECVKKSLNDTALIITVGGTGLCPRDLTPDATSKLYDRNCNGIAAALQMTCLRYSPFAALSRLTSGIIGRTLVVNFPGKPNACKDCFSCMSVFLKHALEQVQFDANAYTETHFKQNKSQQELSKVSDGGKSLQHCAPAEEVSLKSGSSGESSSCTNSLSKLTIQDIQNSRNEMESITQSSLTKNTSVKAGKSSAAASKMKATVKLVKTTVKEKEKENSPAMNFPTTRKLRTESPYPMIDYNQSLSILGTMSSNLLQEPEEVDLTSSMKAYKCLGATLANDMRPLRLVPPYAVSTMDGYVLNIPQAMTRAVEATKTFPSARLVANLQEFVKCQKNPSESSRFFCYQVNTGGRLPSFNYAVIPAEKAGIPVDGLVPIYEVKQHLYVRRVGTDINQNDFIKAGTVLGAVELSAIIAMGHKSIKIFARPKLGVLSTGDEIEDSFSSKTTGTSSVVDTNGPLLTASFRSRGYYVQNCGVAEDKPQDIYNKINEALTKCDVLVISGGASMGSKDHVKDVIESMGGTMHFGRVNMKPGKPASFASLMVGPKRKFIFALPGNPVSAYVTAKLLVVPFLEHARKVHFKPEQKISPAYIGEHIWAFVENISDGESAYKFEGRLEFVRASILSKKREFVDMNSRSVYSVDVSIKQQSSRMLSLVNCDCLIMIDPDMAGQSLVVGKYYHALKLFLDFY